MRYPSFRSLCLRLCLALLATVTGLAGLAHAAVYDYTALPDSGDTFTTALFRIHVPDGGPPVRGVYFFVNPYNSDSRYIVYDAAFQTLAGSADFALLGARMDDMHMDSGIGDALIEALDAFAAASGREELHHAPLFFDGYSWGGQWSYHFTKWRPDRVVGFMTQKGGYHETDPAGEAIYVPGYLFIGEFDLDYRIENLTGIFEEHRPLGARWVLAMHPGAAHERINDRTLLDDYFYAAVDGRLPESFDPGEPVPLRTMVEQTGYLGNRETHEIGYFPCYNADPDVASWCTRRSGALLWQAFVSGGAVTDTIPCDPAGVWDPAGPADPGDARIDDGAAGGIRNGGEALAPTLHAWPNPTRGATTLWLDGTLGEATPRPEAIVVWNVTGRVVRSWPVPASLSEGRPSNQTDPVLTWDGRDDHGIRVPGGVYFLGTVTDAGTEAGPMRRPVAVRILR